MPRLDRTGPVGYGPRSGWGMGPCGAGAGRFRGSGWGAGWRSFYTKSEETEALQEEAKILERDLTAIKERLTELKKK